MTAAYRLKGLGWFGGVVIVSLGFYLISLQVAAERKHLDQVNAKIGSAERDIRALETEFDVRSNLVQLERWNGDTLALVAPTAGQFVRDEAQLASIRFDAPLMGGTDVQTAALVVPSIPDYTPPPVTEAAPVATMMKASATIAKPAPRRESVAEAPAPRMMKAVAVKAASPAPLTTASLRKSKTVAMLDRGLLSDTTLGDLMSGARAERGRNR
ncbi:hypothetical protein M0208_15185 [Sphingomonas sp. SUN019]|uniref:hypothetical protein n=1 Tax=Sphingomonas sp. SUN019 TaxID=2937788 RepID=UPI002164B55E|nr:hypothetical protein [Sphingomonas sp. SUN019]UVO51787.1 hypothetical protein M0208_15185 [Sphingomonas sp. SUN019]